jgi:hypothetical protein
VHLEIGRREAELRVPFGVEEVGRLQVPVALGVERRDRGRVHDPFERGAVAAADRAREARYSALHGRETELPDLELEHRPDGVDRPRAGRDRGGRSLCNDGHSRTSLCPLSLSTQATIARETCPVKY